MAESFEWIVDHPSIGTSPGLVASSRGLDARRSDTSNNPSLIVRRDLEISRLASPLPGRDSIRTRPLAANEWRARHIQYSPWIPARDVSERASCLISMWSYSEVETTPSNTGSSFQLRRPSPLIPKASPAQVLSCNAGLRIFLRRR